MNKSAFEKLMWSIALPGFGQYLNGKYFKETVLLILEFLINVQANFNQVILLSFHEEIGDAIKHVDYQWLMFYPCLYFFAMWDAVKDAGGGKRLWFFSSVCIQCVFCNRWIDFFLKLNNIWSVIRSCLAPNIVRFSWSNNRKFY